MMPQREIRFYKTLFRFRVFRLDLSPACGEDQVEQDADDGSQRDTAELELQAIAHGEGKHAAADTDDEDDRADRQVALVLVVDAAFHQGPQAAGSYDTVQQHRDASHDRIGDSLDQCAELLEERKNHGDDRRTSDNPHAVDLGDGQYADVLAIGGVWGTSPESRPCSGKSIATERPVQARIFIEIASDDFRNDQRIAQMLTNRGEGHDNEGQDRYKVELGQFKMGESEPSRFLDHGKVDQRISGEEQPHDQGEQISADQTDQNRNDAEKALEEDIRHDGDAQRDQCDGKAYQTVVASGVVHGHAHTSRGEPKTDDDDDRSDDHRGQSLVQPVVTGDLDDSGDYAVEDTGAEGPAHRIPYSIGGANANQRGDECERRPKEGRDFCTSKKDVQQSPRSSGEQGCRRT